MYFTAALVLIMVILLSKDVSKPGFIIFGTLLLFALSGIITVDEALRGFSNKGMIAVGMLYIVSVGLQSSGLFVRGVYRLLGEGNKSKKRYFRLLFPVAGLSAFLNNTPIVASLIPMIKSWAKKNDMDASNFLIPLSYAAILGGTCTLIGTSTNLVVHGLLQDSGMGGLGFFEITKIGLPVALIMLTLLSLFGEYLLPKTENIEATLKRDYKKFITEMEVKSNYSYVGETIEKAGLRNFENSFPFQIIREGKLITPVNPQEEIHEEDKLFFTGDASAISKLHDTRGLSVMRDSEIEYQDVDSDKVDTFEVVISRESPLVGMSVKESNFYDRYNGVILAIHREGKEIKKNISDVVLKPADTLFIMASKSLETIWGNSKDFRLISSSVNIQEKAKWKGHLSIGLLIIMILLAATGVLPIVLSAGLTAMIMVGTGVIDIKEAKDAVDWEVLTIIASSFGIATALSNSGFADLIANVIINIFGQFGDMGIIVGLFLATSQFTWVVTNNAVAALMFPVMMGIAQSSGIGMEPLILTLVMGASTCFATPIGYQTNTMVYSTGNYKFKDFLKIGIPMNIIICVIVTIIISLMYF